MINLTVTVLQDIPVVVQVKYESISMLPPSRLTHLYQWSLGYD